MAFFRRGRDSGAVHPELARAVEATTVHLQDAILVRDIAHYVASGQQPQVLARVQQARQAGRWWHPPRESLASLFDHVGRVEPDVWIRWGRVLEAANGTSSWSAPLATAGLLPAWLEAWLGSIGQAYGPESHLVHPVPGDVPVSFTGVAAVAEADGVSRTQLLDALFEPCNGMLNAGSLAWRRVIAVAPSFSTAVVADLERLGGRLTSGAVEQRLLFCTLLPGFEGDDLAALAPHLAVASTSTSSQVRDAARPFLLRALDAGLPALRELAVEAKPDVRISALQLLWEHGGDDDRHFALDTAATDRTPRVQALVQGWLGTAPAPAVRPPELEVPEPPPTQWRVEVTPGLRERVEQAVGHHHHTIERRNERTAMLMRSHPAARERHIDIAPGLAARILDDLGKPVPPRVVARPDSPGLFDDSAVQLATSAEASPVAVLKVLAGLGALVDGSKQLSWHAANALEACHSRSGGPDLLTLQRMLDEMGLAGRAMVWQAITKSWFPLAEGWPDDDVWPFLAANADFVTAHAKPADGDWTTDSSSFYRLVETMPAYPPELVEHLYGVALGTAKTHRQAAQQALRSHPERTRRVAAALTVGKAEARAVAAAWLTTIADPEAQPALEEAVAKEKHDVAKGAMLDALEALGRPVEAYLDRDRLAADAGKTVGKGLPAAVAWVPWDRLPSLHWADSGDPVPMPVVQHLVAQAVRAKNPEPNAILRKHAAMLVEADRQTFAQALLESWIAADLEPISATEAQQRAHQQASDVHRWMQHNPGDHQHDPLFGRSVEELTAHYLPTMARMPAGSQAASKGVLAVVAAMGGREVVPLTERYLKDWYGQRAAQGKALIAMLAWVRHPAATQLLLAIGSRFRTKSFQVEATRQVEALAEREGWTVAELADRTISTAGFDADGRLELSYGERAFVARLLPDLTVELRTEEGTVVKALPAPRQSDDADQAKAAKAAFSGARKELRTLVPLLQQRLYEGLCTERTWAADDWKRFLAGHPVMRLLCQRLVWIAEPAEGPRVVFRLLDDGTLSDVDDDEIVLPDDGVVRLAHDTLLTSDEVEAWLGHLADYEVEPLFPQLGRGVRSLPEELRAEQSLDDVRGHTLEAYALRNRAVKLGWTRGAAEDGGWFVTYVKRFPTLGLLAQLAFTGNSLPEENRLVALLELTFEREAAHGSGRPGRSIALGDVPTVLLSETWHDVHSIAAAGTGHDPDWEWKTQP